MRFSNKASQCANIFRAFSNNHMKCSNKLTLGCLNVSTCRKYPSKPNNSHPFSYKSPRASNITATSSNIYLKCSNKYNPGYLNAPTRSIECFPLKNPRNKKQPPHKRRRLFAITRAILLIIV